MADMYSKPGPGNSKFLYDSDGNVVGRGVTDSSGKTIYTGTSGQYIGKSYNMSSGTTKYINADNQYVGTGISHSVGVSKTDCVGDITSAENGAEQSSSTYHLSGSSSFTRFPSKKSPFLETLGKSWLIISWISYIALGALISWFLSSLIFN